MEELILIVAGFFALIFILVVLGRLKRKEKIIHRNDTLSPNYAANTNVAYTKFVQENIKEKAMPPERLKLKGVAEAPKAQISEVKKLTKTEKRILRRATKKNKRNAYKKAIREKLAQEKAEREKTERGRQAPSRDSYQRYSGCAACGGMGIYCRCTR
ncbi:hypothetical protein [uncultured Alteromonas sp.]|uniref:hypothetical protein n=1 Tax=uncultured Alteromonas sp. TaxID=179113 RepID=UPI0030CD8750|tara:strand:+ start:619 stop:1089 length:471 start_codon:yes stop_codon:yes gene_type:complete